MYGYRAPVRSLAIQTRIDRIVGLIFNVYGPYEDHKRDMRSWSKGLSPRSLKPRHLSFNHTVRHRDGEQKRDFIYYASGGCHATLRSHIREPAASELWHRGSYWVDLNAFSQPWSEPDIRFIEIARCAEIPVFTQAEATNCAKQGMLTFSKFGRRR